MPAAGADDAVHKPARAAVLGGGGRMGGAALSAQPAQWACTRAFNSSSYAQHRRWLRARAHGRRVVGWRAQQSPLRHRQTGPLTAPVSFAQPAAFEGGAQQDDAG